MMKNHSKIERAIEKKYRAKDWRKRKRMKVSGKSVLVLQRLMEGSIEKKIRKLKNK